MSKLRLVVNNKETDIVKKESKETKLKLCTEYSSILSELDHYINNIEELGLKPKRSIKERE